MKLSFFFSLSSFHVLTDFLRPDRARVFFSVVIISFFPATISSSVLSLFTISTASQRFLSHGTYSLRLCPVHLHVLERSILYNSVKKKRLYIFSGGNSWNTSVVVSRLILFCTRVRVFFYSLCSEKSLFRVPLVSRILYTLLVISIGKCSRIIISYLFHNDTA